VRACDSFTRAGGDEFVALMPETDREHAQTAGERLRRCVAEYSLDLGDAGTIDFVRLSVGVAMYPGDGETMDAVVSRADRSIYKAKERGGDSVWLKGDTDLPRPGAEDETQS
jgi:diguanylate cyclase (GGDEF)-like protein